MSRSGSGEEPPRQRSERGSIDREFEELYRQHAPWVTNYARAQGARDPEDIAQEVFLKFFRKRGKFNNLHQCRALLRKLARCAVIDEWRRPNAHLVGDDRLNRQLTADSDHDGQLTTVEILHVLDEALAGLPPRDQRLVILKLRELSAKEIGAIIGSSEEVVRQRWHRLRPLLSAHFSDGVRAILVFTGVAHLIRFVRRHTTATVATTAVTAAGFVVALGIGVIPGDGGAIGDNASAPDSGDRVITARPVSATATPIANSTELTPAPSNVRGPAAIVSPSPSATGEASVVPAPPIRRSLDLDTDIDNPGQKEADSMEVDTPIGPLIVGGDTHMITPIDDTPCLAGVPVCTDAGQTAGSP